MQHLLSRLWKFPWQASQRAISSLPMHPTLTLGLIPSKYLTSSYLIIIALASAHTIACWSKSPPLQNKLFIDPFGYPLQPRATQKEITYKKKKKSNVLLGLLAIYSLMQLLKAVNNFSECCSLLLSIIIIEHSCLAILMQISISKRLIVDPNHIVV